ncbi:class I SAM-dependent methyltransferase [Thalassoglobus sp. JC818]|uniref:class I SAM-dependent methyltransferase n=1 Tax=Thalassoglobus sp. JC818 TaxID=3232136 RepID=UPI003458D0A5
MAVLPTPSHQEIEQFFSTEVKQFSDALSSLESRISPDAQPQADELLEELTEAIHRSRKDCERIEALIGDDAQLLRESQNRFRNEIASVFDQSWFMQRAKEKPRGYPGDFEMLTAIYDGKPKSTGIGGYLDLYFLNSDLARAVCFRLAAIKQFLLEEAENRGGQFAILDVASGPGREFADGLSNCPPIQLTCVDSDEGALDYLQRHISQEAESSIELQCVKYNALKMTQAKKNLEQFGESDLIYSVGLCDYIPDRYLIRMLDGWRQSVSQDGIVYVAFKDCLRYCAAEYQWHVDWYFYQRTEEDCIRLFAEAGYDTDQLAISRDETNIIINFVARGSALSSGSQGLQGTANATNSQYRNDAVTPLDEST